MSTLLRHYARAAVVVLALALLLSALPATARAAGPIVTVTGSGVATCDGAPVPAVVQGEAFDVNLADFPIPVGAGINITLTLPDGSIRGPAAMAGITVPRTAAFYATPTVPFFLFGPQINDSLTLLSLEAWPTGCYRVNVSQAAPPPALLTASAVFRLLPRSFSNQAGNMQLSVQAVGTVQATGAQPVGVNIFGQGVPSTGALTISIVQPDGAIAGPFAPPPGTVEPDGAFNLVYPFLVTHPVGVYTFYAVVTIPPAIFGTPPTIYTAQAQFNLTAPTVTPINNASLEMLDRFSALVPRGTPLSIVARRFNVVPAVTLVIPGGARLAYPFGLIPPPGPLALSPSGNIAIPPVGPALAFGQGFPTGMYTLIAAQPAAPPLPARTATLTWRLIP